MKKVMAVVAGVVVVILAVIGVIIKTKEAASISIIGGADGPTAIFVAGEVGSGGLIGAILLGAILIITGIVIYKIIKRDKH